jgi:glycosyltransferase involved in cell wall biosynthesis
MPRRGVAKKELRIAHVLTSLCIGGGERVALELARIHAHQGMRLAVVSLEELEGGTLGAAFERAGVEVIRVPKRRGFDVTLPPRLLRLFASRRRAGRGFDVVHTHNPLPLIYATTAARAVGARVVHTKHGPHPDRPHRLWLRRAGALAVGAFVAVSEDSRAFASKIREVAPNRLLTIENGVDTEGYRPDGDARIGTRQELGIPSDAWVVGTVGRLAPVKNHALLIRAMAPLLRERAHLVIVGGGPEADSTRALVSELALGASVHLTGPRDDVPRLVNAFDVFALSSDTEGLPLVIPEAMATELPVVATAVGGVPRVILEGETGLLVPRRDEGRMRDALAALRAEPERARRMGKRAREVSVLRYSSQRMADQYLALYRGER